MCSPLWIVLSLIVWSLFSKKFRFLTCVSLLASCVMMFIENCSAIMVCKLDKIPENTCVKNSKAPHTKLPIVAKLVTASCIQNAYAFVIDSPQYQSILS
ncbi:hypothetical protein HpCK102_03930 [Helicobacter pylori]